MQDKKILIIEESSDSENLFESILNESGYKTYIAAGEEDGLELAIYYQPDMILCSTKCFDEGSCIISTLNKREETKAIPIIYVSLSNDHKHINKMLALGADNYVVAPFDKDDFLQIIDKKFEKFSRMKESIIEGINGNLSEKKKREDHILVKIGNKIKLVKFINISCVLALKEYSKVITNENYSIIVRKSLRNWLEILPPQNFLRIHRGTIINTEYLDKIEKTNGRTYLVYLKNTKEPLTMSQRYSNLMRRTFPH